MPINEQETLAQHKARTKIANKGKYAEQQVGAVLKELKEQTQQFDFDRMLDSRAAGGRMMTPQVSDYTLFFNGKAYALEVKSIQKGLRLKKFAQLPRMIRREKAGIEGYVVIFTAEDKSWRVVPISWLALDENATAASWLLSWMPKYASAEAVVKAILKGSLKEVEG